MASAENESSGPEAGLGWTGLGSSGSGIPGLPTTINLTEGSNVVQQKKTVPAIGDRRQ
jgi:hypothetical protein